MTQSETNSRKVLNRLHSLIKAIDGAGDQILHSEMNIGFSQFKILTALKDLPQSSQAALASCLNLTPPAISRHIEVMIGKGLVTKRINPKKKREHLLALTAQGESYLHKCWHLLDGKFDDIIVSLSPKEQIQLISLLDRLSLQLINYKKKK
jgi:MarR family transcriptional regulator, transcriptional regulator for hemolysin